ncbi:MAG: hypothetical protein AAGA16_23825 [Cyanobacteria bacterium P01_E01_bin.35]
MNIDPRKLEIIKEIQVLASELAEDVYASPFDRYEVEENIMQIQTYCNQLDWLEREDSEE